MISSRRRPDPSPCMPLPVLLHLHSPTITINLILIIIFFLIRRCITCTRNILRFWGMSIRGCIGKPTILLQEMGIWTLLERFTDVGHSGYEMCTLVIIIVVPLLIYISVWAMLNIYNYFFKVLIQSIWTHKNHHKSNKTPTNKCNPNKTTTTWTI